MNREEAGGRAEAQLTRFFFLEEWTHGSGFVAIDR